MMKISGSEVVAGLKKARTHVKRFVHGTLLTLTNIHTKHKFQVCLLSVGFVYAMLCHAVPYIPQMCWIICSYSTCSPPSLNPVALHLLCSSIKTRVHFILFRSGGGFHFLFIFFSCASFPTSFSFILRACGCIQI